MGRQTDDAACRRARDDATTAGLAGAEEFYVYTCSWSLSKNRFRGLNFHPPLGFKV